MKKWDRTVLIFYLSAILIAILFVPWVVQHRFGGEVIMATREYGFLFSPPSNNSSIDYTAILLELVGIGVIAGINFILREQLGKWGLASLKLIEKLLSKAWNYWIEEEVGSLMGEKTNRLGYMVYFALLGLGLFSLKYFGIFQ